MKEDLFQQIKQNIETSQGSLKEQLPDLEAEVNGLIQSGTQDERTIEKTLDTLLAWGYMGVGEELFVRLIEYYKAIDAEGAAFYWNDYYHDDE